MNDTDVDVEIGIFYLGIMWLLIQAEVTLLEQKPNSLAFQTLHI